ncbi:MAG: LacI family transcriptional regulator [Anaerolineae bacterium]|nr:LacI family transcriptional regulator [Anaerolineae bacterium]MDW8172027.1 LacI family DNA-binding transcriptional regulator [Anaerolineae bacterium]
MAESVIALISVCGAELTHKALSEGIAAHLTQIGSYRLMPLSLAELSDVHVDGGISLGSIHSGWVSPDHLRALRAAVPLLTLVQYSSREAPSVSFHLDAMLHRAVADLVQRCGRRQIALLSHAYSTFSHQAEGAFQRAMLRHNLLIAPEWLIHAHSDPESVVEALGAFLEAGGALDALLTTSTPAALVALKVLKAHRLRVPRDVCVMGFENSPAAHRVGLTTFASDWQALGHRAARQLVAQLRHGPLVGQTLIDAPLIQRSTCQP